MVGNPREYMRRVGVGGIEPKDAYSHGKYLLEPDRKKVEDYFEIVDKASLLGNLGKDKLLRIYQTDGIILTALYDMAKREPSLQRVFNVLYYGWKAEISLTRAKDGMERREQGKIGVGGLGYDFTPFGDETPAYGYEDEGENKGMIEGVLDKFRGGGWGSKLSPRNSRPPQY